MGKFTAYKSSKTPLFRGAQSASSEPSLPIDGNRAFPLPPKKDTITEYIVESMKRRFLLKAQLNSGFAPAIRVEPPRNDKLFKIRRVAR
jgi:hypothetical protein